MYLEMVLRYVLTNTSSTNILVMAPRPVQPFTVDTDVTFLSSEMASPMCGVKAFQSSHRYSAVVACEGWLSGEGWMVRYGVAWCHALRMRLVDPDGQFYLYLPHGDDAWDGHDDHRFEEVGLVRRGRPIRFGMGWVLCLYIRGQLEFTTMQMRGDGNCQFRAIAVALFGDEERHPRVRDDVVGYMRKHPLSVEWLLALGDISPQKWTWYCDTMSHDKEWGDDVTLGAAARVYNVAFVIQNVTTQTQFLLADERPNAMDRTTRLVYLEYTQDAHYNLRQCTVVHVSHKRSRDENGISDRKNA